ncbi:hypothetical protein D3C87_194530 [compost metagenome]
MGSAIVEYITTHDRRTMDNDRYKNEISKPVVQDGDREMISPSKSNKEPTKPVEDK